MVDEIAVDCVWTSCAPPRTSMVSAIAPTSSVTFTDRVVAASSSSSVTIAVRKPLSDTVTVYLPASSAGTSNAPAVFVTATVSTLVAAFVTTTVAPGSTPAAGSTTMPVIVAFALPPCANAASERGPDIARATRASRRQVLRMRAPCSDDGVSEGFPGSRRNTSVRSCNPLIRSCYGPILDWTLSAHHIR